MPLNVQKMTLKHAPVDKIESWRVKSGLIFAIGRLVSELRPRRHLDIDKFVATQGGESTEFCGQNLQKMKLHLIIILIILWAALSKEAQIDSLQPQCRVSFT